MTFAPDSRTRESRAYRALFAPPRPPRSRSWPPVLASFVGRRASNSVHGWPDDAFRSSSRTRQVLGYTVHLVSHPDAIGRVLLDNKANCERPAVVRRLLARALGQGLFNAEGAEWRDQRRIVAPTFAPAAVARFAEDIAGVHGTASPGGRPSRAGWTWRARRPRRRWRSSRPRCSRATPG